jgi:hypothetical protein
MLSNRLTRRHKRQAKNQKIDQFGNENLMEILLLVATIGSQNFESLFSVLRTGICTQTGKLFFMALLTVWPQVEQCHEMTMTLVKLHIVVLFFRHIAMKREHGLNFHVPSAYELL